MPRDAAQYAWRMMGRGQSLKLSAARLGVTLGDLDRAIWKWRKLLTQS
jgi:hypothetical protein